MIGKNREKIEFAQIISIKKIYSHAGDQRDGYRKTKKSAPRDSKSEDVPQDDWRQPTLKGLKIYYAKRLDETRKGSISRKLIKLKKISLENCETENWRLLEKDGLEYSDSKENNEPEISLQLEEIANEIEKNLVRLRQQRPRRLLIFVNPFGGKGKALSLFKRRVRRLLELAQVDYKLIVTKYANHARDTLEDPKFQLDNEFDGIVCIGGDGMFSELMNGLLFRANSDTSETTSGNEVGRIDLDGQPDERRRECGASLGGLGRRLVSPSMPIGVIGAGSTDANLFGLIGTNDVTSATLSIIFGQQIQIDVCSVHAFSTDRLLRFVSTFIAYGYFGDVVRESERYRWLGPSRYDLTAVNNLIKYRAYHGLVRIWRGSGDGSPSDSSRCHANCPLCSTVKAATDCKPEGEQRGCREKEGHERQSLEAKRLEESLELIECRGPFVGVNAAVTACRCPQTRKGFSPANHLANGCADLILVRPCTRLQYLNYLVRTGYTKKSAFDLKFVEAYRCRQFEFVAPDSEQSFADDFQEEFSTTTTKSNDRSSVLSEARQSSSEKTNSLESSNKGRSQKEGPTHNGGQQAGISQTKVNPIGNEQGVFSSWNADGEILYEQSIRVKVNRRLLRVFGTGEPVKV